MRRAIYVIVTVVLILAAFWLGWYLGAQNEASIRESNIQQNTTENTKPTGSDDVSTDYTSTKGVKLSVTEPLRNAQVTSPLTIKGSVPGNWSFEASFPIKLLDADRNLVAQTPTTLNGDWMTVQMVPFTATLNFTAPSTSTGYLVLEKSNASGEADKDDSVTIPIRFDAE